MLYAFTKEEFNHLAEVVGSLAIDQFNGEQEPYREVIYTIFNSWVEAKENTNGTLD